MEVSAPHAAPPRSTAGRWRGWLCVLAMIAVAGWAAISLWTPKPPPAPAGNTTTDISSETVQAVNRAFEAHWQGAGLTPAPMANDLAVARRLSLALTGTIPSLEEIRALERQEPDRRIDWWLDRLLSDSRTDSYLAERLARAYVGVENGPFLVYRRNRLVRWIGEQLRARRPYDAMAREMIGAEGLWTSNPASNFITATVNQNGEDKGPDQIQLAIRTTRAFLGIRIDCVQCHDDKFGDRWKQADFHQLAAFFAPVQTNLTGVQDRPGEVHEAQYRGDHETRTVPPVVPFSADLLPETGTLRQRLAVWTTHPENLPFARATVNRMWGLLFGRPLVEPVDDLPLDPEALPPGLEILARDFVAHDFDLSHLIRVISATAPFRIDSRSADPDQPLTAEHETHWAAFPLTRLRPEQVAGGVAQATSIDTIDETAPFLMRLSSFGLRSDFVKRHGDPGENELAEQPGTIPQRLLMMNGKMVGERVGGNPLANAVSRIAGLAPDPATAVETAYLCLFTRRPTESESAHFSALLEGANTKQRRKALEDLYWTLLNATEFSWNH